MSIFQGFYNFSGRLCAYSFLATCMFSYKKKTNSQEGTVVSLHILSVYFVDMSAGNRLLLAVSIILLSKLARFLFAIQIHFKDNDKVFTVFEDTYLLRRIRFSLRRLLNMSTYKSTRLRNCFVSKNISHQKDRCKGTRSEWCAQQLC